MIRKQISLWVGMISVFSVTMASASTPPASCPAPAALTDKDCSTHYLALGFIDALLWNTQYLKPGELLSEVSSGTNEAACAPYLAKMTKQVQGGFFHKGCRKADIRDVREILEEASNSKTFCRRTDSTHNLSYDLYNWGRMRNYVKAQLHEKNPELCK